jgi:hypothetical protein
LRSFACLGLSRPVDAFLEACAPDDLVPVAKTGAGPCLAVLVPERGNTIVELAELGGEDDVVSLGQTVQELGALLAGALDLGSDVLQCAHVNLKRGRGRHHSRAYP